MDPSITLLAIVGVLIAISLVVIALSRAQSPAERADQREFATRLRQTESQLKEEQSRNRTLAAHRDEVVARASRASEGYIVLEMPDEDKRMFMDILIGFEEFAESRGFELLFSINGSIPNQVSFRFTARRENSGVTPDDVRQSLMDYIAHVREGDPLSVLKEFPSAAGKLNIELVGALSQRIAYLQKTYKSQQLQLDCLQITLEQVTRARSLLAPQSTFHIHGGSVDASVYSAIDSSGVAQGKGIRSGQSVVKNLPMPPTPP